MPFLLFALVLSAGGVFLFNRLPAKWFCDYGETPDPDRKRLSWWVSALFFALLALVVWESGFLGVWQRATLLLFAFLCLLTAASDVLYRILPDQFLAALALAGLAFGLLSADAFWIPLAAGLAAAGVVFLMGFIGRAAFRAEAMGFGDVKLVAGLGFAAGWPGTAWGLILAVLAGGLAAVPFLFGREKRYLPFAPFLCGGFLAAIIFARELDAALSWYLSLLR